MSLEKKIKKLESVRKKLNSNKVSIGSWMQLPSSDIAEIMGACGYDWITIDMEHGSISNSQLPNIFRALELGNTLPFVRVSKSDIDECNRALEAGAAGIFLPMIQTSNQLSKIIKGITWPPKGKRGVGFSRANLFGANFNKYKKT